MLLTWVRNSSVLLQKYFLMDAIEEEDFDLDSRRSSTRFRRSFPNQRSGRGDMLEIKQNVTRTLKDARRKLNDLRSEVEKK